MSDSLLHDKKYDTATAAELLGVSKRTIQQLAAKGAIPSYRVGNKILFMESDLERYLESCRQNPGAPPVIRRRKRRSLIGEVGKVTHLKLDKFDEADS
jgi:excisionase family DNA binding protein